MKIMRAYLLGLAGMSLLISGCSTCNTCQPRQLGRANVSSNGQTGSHCKPPMWYWSYGYYIPIIDDFLTSLSARSCGAKSLKRQNSGRHLNSDDFRAGYVQAFEDVAQGSGGVMPTVPPPKYWKTNNRSIVGHARADDWFAGYRSGLSRSCYRQVPEQTTIPVSGEQSQKQRRDCSNGNCY